MIYLIGQLSFWLLLTAAFAALAGWAFAAERAAPAERALRRDREKLLRDLAKLASGDAAPSAIDPDADAVQGRNLIRESRIASLEQQLEGARSRADEAAVEIAELKRRLEQGGTDADELRRLRSAQTNASAHADAEDAIVGPSEEEVALQGWRLRYFEQRVRYLETQAKATPEAPEVAPEALNLEWRARDAEARASHLENELRAATAATLEPAAADVEPFAADADVDALLRWRLLYLERRVAHLQAQGHAEPDVAAPAAGAGADPDRWKWRARYLEARVRHLETRAPVVAQQVAASAEEDVAPPPAQTARRGTKPPVLASARNGAPDDLTLIEGVSLLQQTTFYALGVFHYDQIAAWTPDNVAWVDQYLRLRGRIDEEEWVEQAEDLAREGPAAARRVVEHEEN